jgi:peptide/nickel transport system substrate-binding protein
MKYNSVAKCLLVAAAFLAPHSLAQAKDLRINIPADPAQMDPITYSELVSGEIMDNIYEGLTMRTPSGKNVPALAVSWEPLETGYGFRFHLRQGVKFHSGRPFTAKDVKYTYETLLNPDMKGGLDADYLNNIVGADDVKSGKATTLKGVTIVDDNTIDVAFTKPDVLFPIYPVYIMDSGIVAADGPDWMTKEDAGTGPFKFKGWTRGVEVDLTADEDYWGGAPKIDGVRFLIIPDGNTALSQYDAGELDFLDVYQSAYHQVLSDPRYKDEVIKVPRAQSNYMGMNQSLYAPFKDKRVREAISLALPRQAMIKGLFDGAAFELDGIVTPGVAGYDASLLPPLKYDPDLAKQLMSEAGYPGGKGLPPVTITSTSQNKDTLAFYADQLHKVLGMPVSVNVVERATFIKSMNAGKVPFFPWGWTADYPDAMDFLAEMWFGPSPYNRARYENPAFDSLIQKAQTTVDTDQRIEIYHQAEKMLMDDWATVPLLIPDLVALRKPNVHDVTMTPFGLSRLVDTTID